ncbi:hypothetical protein RISK_001923 [Rhodopirellula islandica]|uniref:Uncharacterized protein n=2 Tax=Rhodopirellula islandica TaxID=595434 RepID=A0A0J1BHR6_RHOIS|nr:hypothetical protein RISK_001923 [Rhodopirellula islandica]
MEQVLGVSFLSESKVIGGSESSGPSGSTIVCLITSSEPLPLPVGDQPAARRRPKQAKRPKGTGFPASALLNLLAACEVSEDDVPELASERGVAHVGQVEKGQYHYREAPTTSGWLTAVEFQFD